jgi:hypothetical protein
VPDEIALRRSLAETITRLRRRGVGERWVIETVASALVDAGVRALIVDLVAFERDSRGKRTPRRCPVRRRDGGYEVYEVRWFSRLEQTDAPGD